MPPAALVWLGLLLARCCYALLDAMIPGPMRVADLAVTSYTLAEVLRTLCALGIPDALAAGPATAAEVAIAIGTCTHACPWICLSAPGRGLPAHQSMHAHLHSAPT